MESRSSKWPARIALLISILMFGAVMGPLSAFGQTTDVPNALQTTSSPSGSGSPSASSTPCRFSPAPPPLCPSSSASASGSPTPSGSPTGSDEETHDSKLTITYGNDRFSGVVRSDSDCKPKRKVIVRKVRKGPNLIIGRDTTNKRGRWAVPEPDPKRGRYYAKVLKRVYTVLDTTVTCRGDKSPVIRVV